MKKNHRIRRRRASTGEAFGSRSRHSSPTSIRDFTTIPASSFDDAFKKGTILPYFLDTAVKSFDSAMRSYSSCDVAYATTGLKNEGYLFQSKLEEQPYEEQKQQLYQHSGQTKHQQPSGTTGTTRIKRRPHQQRRCKSLNDLRIHHDRELDEIEIERPRSTDDSTDSDDYYTEGEFDDDDENDCNYSTATTTITTTHVSSSSLEENVSCVFVSAEAAASYSLPVSTSAQCLLYRSSQQQEKQQQDDETNNTLEYVSESIQKTQQQQEDDNSEQDSSLSPATTTTLTSTMVSK